MTRYNSPDPDADYNPNNDYELPSQRTPPRRRAPKSRPIKGKAKATRSAKKKTPKDRYEIMVGPRKGERMAATQARDHMWGVFCKMIRNGEWVAPGAEDLYKRYMAIRLRKNKVIHKRGGGTTTKNVPLKPASLDVQHPVEGIIKMEIYELCDKYGITKHATTHSNDANRLDGSAALPLPPKPSGWKPESGIGQVKQADRITCDQWEAERLTALGLYPGYDVEEIKTTRGTDLSIIRSKVFGRVISTAASTAASTSTPSTTSTDFERALAAASKATHELSSGMYGSNVVQEMTTSGDTVMEDCDQPAPSYGPNYREMAMTQKQAAGTLDNVLTTLALRSNDFIDTDMTDGESVSFGQTAAYEWAATKPFHDISDDVVTAIGLAAASVSYAGPVAVSGLTTTEATSPATTKALAHSYNSGNQSSPLFHTIGQTDVSPTSGLKLDNQLFDTDMVFASEGLASPTAADVAAAPASPSDFSAKDGSAPNHAALFNLSTDSTEPQNSSQFGYLGLTTPPVAATPPKQLPLAPTYAATSPTRLSFSS